MDTSEDSEMFDGHEGHNEPTTHDGDFRCALVQAEGDLPLVLQSYFTSPGLS